MAKLDIMLDLLFSKPPGLGGPDKWERAGYAAGVPSAPGIVGFAPVLASYLWFSRPRHSTKCGEFGSQSSF